MYYVRPTDGETVFCPAQPCLTINQLSHPSSLYLTYNNTLLKFLPGKRPLEIHNVENLTLQGLNGALLQLDPPCHCQRQQCIQLPFHYLQEIVLSGVCCSVIRLTSTTVRDLSVPNLLSGVMVENCVKSVINHLYNARDGIVSLLVLNSRQLSEVHNTSVGVSFMNTSESAEQQ